ncbi:peptidase domain-containing ABC transporter [Streptomyces sp. LZ34]
MVLAHRGLNVTVDQLREETNTGRDGVSARALLEAARRFGLTGRGVRVTLPGLRSLSPGSILFWNFRHFVVLERATRDHVYIVDPAHGRRRLAREEVGRMFTGVALEFESSLHAAAGAATIPPVTRTPTPWSFLRHFFPRHSSWFPLVMASLALLLFSFATPFASAYAVDHIGSDSYRPSTWQYALAITGLVGFYFILQLIRGLAILNLQTAADKRVTLGVFYHLLSLPYQFFTRRSPGDLALRVRTSTAVRQVLTNSTMSAICDGILVSVYLVLLILADHHIALLVFTLAALQVLLLISAWKRQAYLTADALESQAQAESQLHEILENIVTLKSAGLEGNQGENWSHSFADEVNARNRSRRHLSTVSALSTSIQMAAPLLVLLLAVHRVQASEISIGDAVAFTSLSIGLFAPLTSLIQAGVQVAGLRGTLARLGDVLTTEPEPVPSAHSSPAHRLGDIRLRDVHFSYPGGAGPALADVSLRIPEGSFFAIIGRSGCGKSTLATVLAGLVPPSRGEYSIGETVMRDDNRVSVRKSMGFINQDSRIFAGSIRDNIAMGLPEVSDTQVHAAAAAALVHDEIMAMPMKYETLLGVGGAGISGGQRQRIALARALVRGPLVLIMDEATSALDQGTEEEIFSRVRALGCTLIVITHRLSVIREADSIVVFSDGRIAAVGSHEELAASSGLYRSLGGGADDPRQTQLTNPSSDA